MPVTTAIYRNLPVLVFFNLSFKFEFSVSEDQYLHIVIKWYHILNNSSVGVDEITTFLKHVLLLFDITYMHMKGTCIYYMYIIKMKNNICQKSTKLQLFKDKLEIWKLLIIIYRYVLCTFYLTSIKKCWSTFVMVAIFESGWTDTFFKEDQSITLLATLLKIGPVIVEEMS